MGKGQPAIPPAMPPAMPPPPPPQPKFAMQTNFDVCLGMLMDKEDAFLVVCPKDKDGSCPETYDDSRCFINSKVEQSY